MADNQTATATVDSTQSSNPAPVAAEPAVPEVPKFYAKDKPAEAPEQESGIDPTKLSPELQTIYKSMQADYTKKSQALAEKTKEWELKSAVFDAQKREFEKSQETFRSLLEQRQAPQPQADPMDEVKRLRDEGRYEDADRLLLDYARKAAAAETEPLRREAESQARINTFLTTMQGLESSDPLVKSYMSEVQAAFNSMDPASQAIKKDLFASPQYIQRYAPMLARYVALERHVPKLEAENAALRKQLEKASVTTARRIPGQLVETGNTSRSTGKEYGSIKDAFEAAVSQL